MSLYRFLYRLAGSAWLAIGIFIAIIGLAYIVIFNLINDYVVQNIPIIPTMLKGIVGGLDPKLNSVAAIGLAIFFCFFGSALLQLKPWTRAVGSAFHIGMGMFVIMTGIIISGGMPTLDINGNSISEIISIVVLVICLFTGLGLIALGFQMGTNSAMTIFFGQVPAVAAQAQATCPTCGGRLDVKNERCPKCDAGQNQAVQPPPRPRLIDMQSGQEFTVYTTQLTTIGRDTNADIELREGTVSKDHAVIEYTEGIFFLHARKDTNGTYVNDERIRDKEIKHDDIIGFGRVRLLFLFS